MKVFSLRGEVTTDPFPKIGRVTPLAILIIAAISIAGPWWWALIALVVIGSMPGTGIVFQLRGGDVCHPWGSGDWFKPPYFLSVWRWYCRWPVLPYFAYRWDAIGRQGYIGFKAYGADSEAYKHWMNPADVYPGSIALQMSARPFAKITK